MIVSRYTGSPPLGETASRTIPGGPLYPVGEVLELLEKEGAQIIAWTNKCQRDIQKWELDLDDLCQLIELAVSSGRFRGSEWCVQHSNGPWAACDAYSLVRREWIKYARKEVTTEYYIKFAIAKTGELLILASCHPPEDRR